MPATPNIIDQLGKSWKLHVQEHATFSYDHPTFGLLEYTGTEAWLCDNVNTLSLTSQGNLPDGVLPQKVCIRPKYDGKCGCYDTVIYTSASEQCECADNGCPQTHTLWLRCDDCYENDTQTISRAVPGIGRSCSNPSYTMTSTLCSQTLTVTWYCCEGSWVADVTLNGHFCGTYGVPLLSKCPLVLGVGTSDCDSSYYADCTLSCIGIDAPCDVPGCCDYSGDLTLTIVTTDPTLAGMSPIVIPNVTPNTSWEVDTGAIQVTIDCAGGVYSINFAYADCSFTADATSSGCDPIDIDFGTHACSSSGGPYDATFTAVGA